MALVLHNPQCETLPPDRVFDIQRLEGCVYRAATHSAAHEQLLLCAAGVLFHAAQKVVHDLPGQRHQPRAVAATRLFDDYKYRRPKIVDWSGTSVSRDSREHQSVDRLLGNLR